MLNYEIAPEILQPRVPAGTELDYYEGKTFVSVIGFRFLRTQVLGVPIPLHRDFDEVNLRFYVRARGPEGWRRGVVFVRELVPRWAIAWVARTFYGEPYTALPMRHRIEQSEEGIALGYEWRRGGVWEGLELSGRGEPRLMNPGSMEEFIAEHYWGFTGGNTGSTQYAVEHEPWRVWDGIGACFRADVATLYGPEFVETLGGAPSSAFIAEGSPVVVRMKSRAG